MFLKQVQQFSKTEWWRYTIGVVIITFFYSIGQIPLTIAWIYKKGSQLTDETSQENSITNIFTTGWKELQNTPQKDLMGILDHNTTLFYALLMFVFALTGILICLRIHQQSFKSLITARNSVSWKRILFSFGLLSILIFGFTFLEYFSNPEGFEWNFQLQPFLILCLIACALMPIQTSVEEFIFRGYLLQGFGILTKNRGISLLLTSLIFGALHFTNPEVDALGIYAKIFYIGTGLFLGILTLMDDGMELALGFHAANNLITALLVTADYSVIQTPAILKQLGEPEPGVAILMPLLVMYPILLFVFAKKYKWTNWKQRLLTGNIL